MVHHVVRISPRARDRTHSNCDHSTRSTLLRFVMVAGGGARQGDQSARGLQNGPSTAGRVTGAPIGSDPLTMLAIPSSAPTNAATGRSSCVYISKIHAFT